MAMVKIKRKEPSLWYVGSLVQQNFGESFEGHGYAVVDLTKDKLEPEFYDIPNDHGYFTLDVEDGVLPDNLPITAKTNVRLRARNTSPAEVKRILATIRRDYRNSDVLVQRLDKIGGDNSTQSLEDSLHQGDVRNIQYQNQLITDYLHSLDVDDQLLESILKINADLNRSLPQSETARNVIWKPKKFEFSNMFSYGEDNVINFDKLEGICGLFAPNHAGKSAILDALCFCLFDQSFRASKAEQVLNKKKEHFWCKLNFELGGLNYFIEKKAHKYKSGPLKGKLRVDIEFWYVNTEGEIVSLNGEQRRDTDKIIQSYVGAFDDFILTALSLQQNNSNFIDKTQSERKDLLANFLDLKIFDSLYELANKENRTTSVVLEEYQKQDFETKLGDAERLKIINEAKYVEADLNATTVEQELQNLTEQLLDFNKQIQPCTADGLDINQLENDEKRSSLKLDELKDAIVELEQKMKQQQLYADELTSTLRIYQDSFDTELYKEYSTKLTEKVQLDQTLSTLKLTISNKLSKLEKLKQHEYDPNCNYCVSNVFVKDAVDTKAQLEDDKQTVHNFLIKLKSVTDFINDNKSIQDQASEIQDLMKKHSEAKVVTERYKNTYEHYIKDIDLENQRLAKIQREVQTYNDNLAVLDNNKQLQTAIKDLQGKITIKKVEISKLNNVVKDYHAKIKVGEQTIAESYKAMEHMQELADRQVAYDLYCKAVCKDGIPYILISKAVPYIQQYVNNILNQVIDFNVELETDGKNINAFICYEDTKWPLELSSGMERFISSLALRIALVKITNLPKPDFIAIDEGLGVLDSSNLNSMHILFTYMKEVFKFSLIISHIDVVRDMVDNILTISRKDELSNINC
jgi:DNA repair exonuclease SbcCD ATPase subunit